MGIASLDPSPSKTVWLHFEKGGPPGARTYAGWPAICIPIGTPTKGRSPGNLRPRLIPADGYTRCSHTGKHSTGGPFTLGDQIFSTRDTAWRQRGERGVKRRKGF